MKEEEKPILESAIFNFIQDGKCCGGEEEYLEIRVESSVSIDREVGGEFYILKTEQWAI